MQNHSSFVKTTLVLAFGLALPLFAAQPAPAQKAAAAAPVPAAAAPSKSAAVQNQKVVLNQKDIHAAYNEGDFDKVTSLIDGFIKANKTYSRADSIFIAKHLAVVYSANPQSREKGRYFMYRLLEMMPSAELVDMFVSDEIDRIFDKVRREFLARQKGFGVDSTQISTPEKASTGSAAATTGTASAKPAQTANPGPSSEFLAAGNEEKQPYWKRNGFWIAGGVGLIVAGTAAYFIYTQDEPTGKKIVIPAQTTAQQ
ncbi:MAG: hypothetical protein JWO30_4779 [Fibrobacteres bacterium]|nr:hypothetical protein [Fibrobacterota bacterium]